MANAGAAPARAMGGQERHELLNAGIVAVFLVLAARLLAPQHRPAVR